MDKLICYRAQAWGQWLGPWRQSRLHAEEDALAAREGHQDPWPGAPIYLSPACSIMAVRAQGPVLPGWKRSKLEQAAMERERALRQSKLPPRPISTAMANAGRRSDSGFSPRRDGTARSAI